LDRFSTARAFAVPAVIEQMRQGSTPEVLAMWNGLFPGQILDSLVLAELLLDHAIDLEGHQLIPLEVGYSDTGGSTVLRVLAIGLVVGGDAVYNDVHQYLRESGPEGRRAWMVALDIIESLRLRTVIAGHQRAGRHDGPEIIEETC